MSKLTLSEALTLLLVIGLTAVMLTADIFDKLGLRLAPWPVVGVALALTAGPLLGAARCGRLPHLDRDTWAFIAWLGIVNGVWLLLLRLAWPSFLPLVDSEDAVAHWLLIDWLRAFGHTPRDPALDPYLGQLGIYPPGFHYLVYLGSSVLPILAERLIHPILALLVALKAGCVFLTARRTVGGSVGVGAGLVAAALLALPFSYTLWSFTRWSFYPQVASETFAVATLWATVWLAQGGGRPAAVVVAVTLVGQYLTWPAWLPISLVTAAWGVWSTRGLSRRWPTLALAGVGGVVGGLVLLQPERLLRYIQQATARGGVVEPSVEAFTPVLLMLGGLGALLCLAPRFRTAPTRAAWPVVVFATATLAQAAALYLIDTQMGAGAFYPVYKMAHLLVYPLAVLGGVAIGWLAWRAGLRRPGLAPVLAWLGPSVAALLVMLALGRGLLTAIPPSAFSEDVFDVGAWAARNLPGACVEYVVPRRVSRFWLHVGWLGNPWWGAERRADVLADDSGPSLAAWEADPAGRPYAIVAGWRAQPPQAQQAARVLYQAGDVAVVRHAHSNVTCPMAGAPLRPRPAAPD